jgi:hypothetical protein
LCVVPGREWLCFGRHWPPLYNGEPILSASNSNGLKSEATNLSPFARPR